MKKILGILTVAVILFMGITLPAIANGLLTIQNHSGYAINITIDGISIGNVAASSEASMSVPEGAHVLEGYQVGNSNNNWGPRNFIMDERGYKWGLWDQSQSSIMPVDFTVVNNTGVTMTISIDGQFWGTVGPYQNLVQGIPRGSHNAYATGSDNNSWGPRFFDDETGFTWTLVQ